MSWLNTKRVRHAVLVGSGAIGVEVAYLAARRGVRVHIVEMLDRVLPRSLDPELSCRVEDYMRGQRVDAHYDDRTVRTDQSIANGGGGSAPAPFDLFFASIATCVGIYVLEFCLARDLDTTGLGVRLRAEEDPQQHRYPAITIALRLPDGFPERYRRAILRTADLCTVKKHILDPPSFAVVVDE